VGAHLVEGEGDGLEADVEVEAEVLEKVFDFAGDGDGHAVAGGVEIGEIPSTALLAGQVSRAVDDVKDAGGCSRKYAVPGAAANSVWVGGGAIRGAD